MRGRRGLWIILGLIVLIVVLVSLTPTPSRTGVLPTQAVLGALPSGVLSEVPTEIPTATATLTPLPLELEPTQPLMEQLAAIEGVRGVDVVSVGDGMIYVEAQVAAGQVDQLMAVGMLRETRAVVDVIREFTVILDDGTQATDFTWLGQQNEWRVTPLTAISTARAAPTVTRHPTAVPQASVCNGKNDLNCSDFSSQQAAQAHMEQCGDEDALDGDHDGVACEMN